MNWIYYTEYQFNRSINKRTDFITYIYIYHNINSLRCTLKSIEYGIAEKIKIKMQHLQSRKGPNVF